MTDFESNESLLADSTNATATTTTTLPRIEPPEEPKRSRSKRMKISRKKETSDSDDKDAATKTISCQAKTSQNSAEKIKTDYSQLIPVYIKHIITKPKTAGIRINFDAPTQQTTFTYSISWEDEYGTEEKYRRILNNQNVRVSSNEAHSPNQPTSVETNCDGPCNGKFPSNLLNSIGRCGHYLCNICSSVLKNADGTIACSSVLCYWNGASREESLVNYEREVYRVYQQLQESSNVLSTETNCAVPTPKKSSLESSTISTTTSSTASTAKNDKYAVKLIIVEPVKGGAGMRHTYVEMKLPAGTRLNNVLESLLLAKKRDAVEHLTNGVLYYAELLPDSTKELHRIRRRDFKKLFIADFPKGVEPTLFVLDMTDFVMKKAKSSE